MGLGPCAERYSEEDESLHLLYDLLAPPLELYVEGFVKVGNRTFQDLLRHAGLGDPLRPQVLPVVLPQSRSER